MGLRLQDRFVPAWRRLEELAYRLGLDRLAFRIWRYNPASLYRWYQHHQFDREFQVDTRGYSDFRYEPTPADRFKTMMGSIPLPLEDLLFVDFGSGKGKTLLMAAEYPFRRIIGVELWPDLHRIAEENIRRYRGRAQRCFAIESVSTDAARYAIPEEPAVFYFFNPFAEKTLRQVLENLEHSLVRCPRTVFIAFYSPVRRGAPWDRRTVLDEARFLKEIRSERTYSIYTNS